MSGIISIMIQIGDGVWVNALEVTEIKRAYDRNLVWIKLRDGNQHVIAPEYKQSVFDLEKRIVDHVNHAAATYSGKVEHAEPKF